MRVRFSIAKPCCVGDLTSPKRLGTASEAAANGWSRNSKPQLLKIRPPTALKAATVSGVMMPVGSIPWLTWKLAVAS